MCIVYCILYMCSTHAVYSYYENKIICIVLAAY